MASTPLPIFLRLVAFLLAALGVAVAAAGLWLIVLGGSWYYAIAGVLLAATAFLLLRGRAEALWCGAVLVGGTLAWAVWEVGIAWWPLTARGDVVFLIGLLLVTDASSRKYRKRATVRRRCSPCCYLGNRSLTVRRHPSAPLTRPAAPPGAQRRLPPAWPPSSAGKAAVGCCRPAPVPTRAAGSAAADPRSSPRDGRT